MTREEIDRSNSKFWRQRVGEEQERERKWKELYEIKTLIIEELMHERLLAMQMGDREQFYEEKGDLHYGKVNGIDKALEVIKKYVPYVSNNEVAVCRHEYYHVEELPVVICTDCGEILGKQTDC